jgi:hypothetical protein
MLTVRKSESWKASSMAFYTHVVQDKKKATEELSKLGSSRAKVPHGVFIQDLVNPSIKEAEDHMVEKPPD